MSCTTRVPDRVARAERDGLARPAGAARRRCALAPGGARRARLRGEGRRQRQPDRRQAGRSSRSAAPATRSPAPAPKAPSGPNLDEAFRASIDEGLQRSAVRGVVEGQIRSPTPKARCRKTSSRARRSRHRRLRRRGGRRARQGHRPARHRRRSARRGQAGGREGRQALDRRQPQRPARLRDQQGDRDSPAPVTIEMPNMSGVSHNIAIEAGRRRRHRQGRRSSARAPSPRRAPPRST